MKHSIATVSLAGTLVQKLDAIAAAGFDGVELFESDLTASDMTPHELRRRALDLGLEIVALQPFRDFESMPDEWRERNLRRARHKLELAAELGASRLLICSNVSPLSIDDNERAAADLCAFGDLAREYDIQIGYEALAWGRHVSDYQKSWDIVRTASHSQVGIILDSFHILVKQAELDTLRAIPRDKITLVQVADAPHYDMGTLWLSRHYRSFPGQGSMDIAGFSAALKATGYDDYLSHEIFSDAFRSARIYPTALDGKRSLVWMGRLLSDNADVRAGSGETVTDIEFVEFSCDAESQLQIARLLTGLGFTETHVHRSKDVSLYRLGDVQIVLNRQQDSHSYSYFLDYGVAVCAVGFSTSEPCAVQAWAGQLSYPGYDSKSAAGELQIPAIQGPAGVLYYLIDQRHAPGRFFEVDFVTTDKEPRFNGVRRIDHIGQAVSFQDYLSATLFYKTVLGLSIDDSMEVNDPYGVVISRTAHNESRSVQIPLSTSQSWGASPNRFIERLKEGGIQQIALLTDDIFRTAESVPSTFKLKIPENFYRDLRSRATLPAETIDRMQALNILYDEDAGGSFFNFYTTDVNGLFFEVLQRRDDYRGFGEPNAHVRLAAQARPAFDA